MAYLDKYYRAPQESSNPAHVWWRPLEKGDRGDEYVEAARASSLIDCAQALETHQSAVHQQNLWSAQLYSNRELAAFDWGTGQLNSASLEPVSRTSENITVRVVDTLVSQIGKNRPKPKPVARGASFTVRNQIRLLDKFLYGEFQRNMMYALGKQVFRDACIFGFGCLKISMDEHPEHGARVEYERVFPDEILIDQMEVVACGRVKHFYRRRALPIEVVSATYGIDEEDLKDILETQQNFSYLDYRPVGAGWIIVVEAYQLGYKGAPGRWMVATKGKVLDEGEWPHDWLPYVFYHWQMPVSGFYSSSVVEQALPYQIRLNEVNDVIRDAQDIMGRPRVFIAEGSRVNPLEIDNVIGRFIKYTGIKPEAMTWPAMNAELYNERDRCIGQCLEHFGLSNLATTVTPPPGARFDSSPAFREFNAIQDDRLSDPSQRFEEFYLEVAKRTCQVIDASGSNPKTVWYSGYKSCKAEVIEWDELGHSMDSYIMSMEAVSIYSMSPSAGRDELEKQLAMGLISPEEYRLELCSPDQESEYSLQAAAAFDLIRVMELLESGEFENPTPQQDLVSGVEKMSLALLNLNKYKDDGEGPVRLADVKLNFVNWITEAQAILARATEQTPETASSLPPVPGAPPGGAMVPVPEAMGLAPAGPGPMPNI